MSVVLKLVCIVTILAIVEFESVTSAGGGQCGKLSPDKLAIKLASCAQAAKVAKAAVPKTCCAQTKIIGRNPKCLCAVLFSPTAKRAGVIPKIAVTIPKRCNLPRRKGTKCGPYIVP
ncbi:hypothetical protein CASFOL_015651 [Castilleja foliolosa]|uniref:Bifunctional inhibitor/plant lipid transfer protein/seed storage helical domain-containing protein n=1 Tax=Castilleja foliolosa TaxID=1961234 RepID=A0ABD3DEW5_9LAMI